MSQRKMYNIYAGRIVCAILGVFGAVDFVYAFTVAKYMNLSELMSWINMGLISITMIYWGTEKLFVIKYPSNEIGSLFDIGSEEEKE
jgi:hypothetical protein